MNLTRIEEDLSQAHLRLSRVYIDLLSWEQCISKYDRPATLHYLDPPYWQTEGYGVAFDFEQYQLIAKTMHSMQGKAILSINDHPDIRDAFKRFPMQEVGINYMVGGVNKKAQRKELIIRNW